MTETNTARVLLYVPGSRPDRFEKAAATGATVVLDLEDAVASSEKAAARIAVARWSRATHSPLQVRVNAPESADLTADLAAISADVDLRLPKVQDVADLEAVRGRRVHVLLETALGVERAFDIANATEVVSIGLGEADLRAELN